MRLRALPNAGKREIGEAAFGKQQGDFFVHAAERITLAVVEGGVAMDKGELRPAIDRPEKSVTLECRDRGVEPALKACVPVKPVVVVQLDLAVAVINQRPQPVQKEIT